MEVPAGSAGTIVEINVALGDQLGEGADDRQTRYRKHSRC